jgi:CRP-like cAMP-binding protein
MAETSNLEILRSLEFFHDIAARHLEQLAEILQVVEFPARKTIFQENDRAKEVYFIVSGEVSLVICAPQVSCRQIATVRTGELMGWSPLLSRRRLSDTARTLTPVRAVVFDGAQLLDFCRQHPDFGFEFMRRAAGVLSERLDATRMQLLDLGGVKLPEVAIDTD